MLEKLKIDRRLLKQLDLKILILSIMIVVFGAINIYSATHNKSGIKYFKAQLIWLLLGLILTYFILIVDYAILERYASVIYWAMIVLLVLNDFVLGSVTNGSRSWIKLGPVAIQTSEFAKLAMIIMVSKKISQFEGKVNNFKNLVNAAIYPIITMIFIVIQPDMGMTMVCFFTVLGIFFVAGLDVKIIATGMVSIVLLIVIIWNSSIMPIYWKGRLTSFINPEKYQLTSGHQIVESKIAIGEGGILGSGFKSGSQISGGFIPEVHTDFIFSVVGEEWGLLGAIFLLTLYGSMIYRFIKIAKESKDLFGSLICIGIVSSFIFSILQNIGMTISIVPVTGITLPFMSYGGSSMITNFMSIALVLNIGMRRKKINF